MNGSGSERRFRLVFFERSDGTVPVREFLQGLSDARHETKIVSWLLELEQKNLSLREPFVKPLGEGLWELRIRHGHFWYRVLFFYHADGEIVLTNAFRKETEKTPAAELDRAREARRLYERFRNRYPGSGRSV